MDLKERGADGSRRHPWEVVRSRFFLDLLDHHGALRTRADWLDVGAGDAWLGGQLRTRLPPGSTVVGWDINYQPDDLHPPTLPDGMELTSSRPERPFDGVLLLDVIEHVPDDRRFVADIVGGLTGPDGWLLVSVPAWPSMFSDHDRFLGHHRRYRPRQCVDLLVGAGVDVVASGGVFHSLLGIRALQIGGQRWAHRPMSAAGVGAWTAGPTVTGAITAALAAEVRASAWVAQRDWQVPGLSFWLLGRRRP